MLSIESRQPADIAQCIAAASLDVKQKLSDHEDFDPEDHKEATNYLLGFLWCHCKNILNPSAFSTSDDSEITCWAQNLHKQHLLTTSVTSPPLSSGPSPSDSTLSSLASTVHSLTVTLEKSQSSKSEKKNKFDQMDQFVHNLTLNASTKHFQHSALVPSDDF